MVLFVVGVLFLALGGAFFSVVNVAFGNMFDLMVVGDVGLKINNVVIVMEIVVVFFGVSLMFGYWFMLWGVVRAARNMRSAFV